MRIVLIRHSARVDYADRSWTSAAARPWDTPITVAGEELAAQKAREIVSLMQEKFPQYKNVARVYCSPFTRCVQTLSKMIPSFQSAEHPLKVCVEPSVCEFMAQEWLASLFAACATAVPQCRPASRACIAADNNRAKCSDRINCANFISCTNCINRCNIMLSAGGSTSKASPSQPSRPEAALPAGSIMLSPSDLQALVGDCCAIDMEYSPFRPYDSVLHTFESPETQQAQQIRLLSWIKHLETLHSQDTIVICTHGGCMMVLDRTLTGAPTEDHMKLPIPGFCGSIWLSNDSGQWVADVTSCERPKE